jgi:hypothetical protein
VPRYIIRDDVTSTPDDDYALRADPQSGST